MVIGDGDGMIVVIGLSRSFRCQRDDLGKGAAHLQSSHEEINEALNYVADTLLFAGAALALASALPRDDGLEEA